MTKAAGGHPNRGIFSSISILALFLAVLSGCLVGPNYRRPDTKVPDKWSGQAAATPAQPSKTTTNPVSLVEWWQSFNDPILASLVEIAIRSNLDLRLAEARIFQARAARGVVGAPLFPQVNASFSYARNWSSQNAQSTGTISGAAGTTPQLSFSPKGVQDLFKLGFDSTWELDIFGGTRRNLEAATADLRAAVEDRRDVLVTLLGDVGTNYLNLRGFQEQIAIARKNLVAQRRTAEIIRKRFEAGFISALDVANAYAQVSTTESTIPPLESSARAAIYALGVLLGQEPAFLEQDLLKKSPIPPTPPEIPLGLPSDLLRRRPDIRRSEAQLHAATARVGVATADLFPKFSLIGTSGLSSADLMKLMDWRSKFWSVGPSVTWPIFAGGRIYWNIKVQNALQEQALITYQKAVLTALKDVETALVAYAKEQERRKVLTEAVAYNRRAVDLSTKLYLVGKSDFLNVLIAQRSLFASEDALAQSTRTVDTNLIALYKALGGGWEKTP